MKKESIKSIIQSLNDAGVRYLIAGGLAVVAHGYLRFTADIDLIVGFDKKNLERAIEIFSTLGYRPRFPVNPKDFANPSIRKRWIEEKHMVVFSFISDIHRETPVDLFVEEPFDFDNEYEHAAWFEVDDGVEASFVSFDLLIKLKEESGRDKDKLDLYNLKHVQEIQEDENGIPER